MQFGPGDIIALVNATAWPVITFLIVLIFSDTIREFLRGVTKTPLKTLTTPFGSVEFAQQKLEEELKDPRTLQEERGETIKLDAESVEEFKQNMKIDDFKLQSIKIEFRLLYLEQMIDWILTNNSAFVKNLSQETLEEFRRTASERLKVKYPEYFE